MLLSSSRDHDVFRALTLRRRLFDLLCQQLHGPFRPVPSRSISSNTVAMRSSASSSSPEVCASRRDISPMGSLLRVWKEYCGTLTLMMFLNSISSSTLWRGYSRACSSISGLMIALDDLKGGESLRQPPARRARAAALLRRTMSMNWRISSSRLSFISLWPRRRF